MNLLTRWNNRRNRLWWRGYRAGQKATAASRADDGAHYKARYDEMYERIYALADQHSRFHLSGTHAIDTYAGSTVYCDHCSSQWPCPSFRWATNRDFAPLKLSLKTKEN